MIKIKFQDFLDEISEEILIKDKKITLFIGSGFSIWFGYPSWQKLFLVFCSKVLRENLNKKTYLDGIKEKVKNGYSIPLAFDEIINELNLEENYLYDFLITYFKEIDRVNRQKKLNFPGLDLEKYRLLCRLSKYCKVITTNFDTLIEDIFKMKFNIQSRVFYYDTKKLKRNFFSRDNNNYSILKLHGDIRRRETLIVSEKDYRKTLLDKKYRLLRNALRENFASEINIFIGYSISDKNIRQLLIDNQEIYGSDKEKNYIVNLYNLIEIFMKEQQITKEDVNQYKELGVDEIFITCYDELFTILKYITHLYQIKERLPKEVHQNYLFQRISKNHSIWEQVCFAIILCNSHLTKMAQKVLYEIIEEFDGDKDTDWCYIYGLLGVILSLSKDERIRLEGEKFISRAIRISTDKALIYYQIGRFYLISSMKKIYTTNISDNLGTMIYIDKEAARKALSYFELIENKSDMVKYQIFKCESRNGNQNKAIEIGYELLEGNYPEEDIYVEMGFNYYNLAMKIKDENDKLKCNYFRKSVFFFEKYINTESFLSHKIDNKKVILEMCIKSLVLIGEYDKAKIYCDKLSNLDPTSSNLHLSLIEIYIYQDQYEKVIEECDYLLNHTKSYGKIQEIVKYIKAQCIFANANYTHEVLKAIDLCEEVLEKGEYADVAYTIACMYQHIGRFYKMREYIVKSCYYYPLNDKLFDYAITLLGSSFPSEGNYFNFNEAATSINELTKHRNKYKEKHEDDKIRDKHLYKHLNIKPKHRLKKMMIIDNINIIDFILDKIDIQIPDDIKIEIQEALDFYNNKEYIKAIEIFSKYEDELHDNYIFKYVYANSLANANRLEQAVGIYKEIIEKYLDYYDDNQKKIIYYYSGDYFFEVKAYGKACEYYFKALELDKNFLNAIFRIGESFFKLSIVNDHEFDINLINQSRMYFEKYIEHERYDWEAYSNLSYIYSIIGGFDKVIEISRRWINYKLPHDVLLEFYNYLIISYLTLENDHDAKIYIDKAEKLIGDVRFHNIRSKNNLFKFYYYKGIYYADYSYEKAVGAFKKAYDILPTEKNRANLEINIKPGTTFYLQNDFKTIIRGGEKYKPTPTKKG